MADAVALLLMGAAVVGVFLFVRAFAVDVFYADQWTDVAVVQQFHAGTLTFATLWQQHDVNRVLVPRLLVLALASTTHFDVIVEDQLCGVLACLSTALIVLAHRRRTPGVGWLPYLPCVLVLLSFVPLGDALFGFNLSWYLVIGALGVCVYLLDRPDLTGWATAGAVAAAMVGTFSSVQGLLLWPVGLLLVVLRRRPRWVATTWVAAGVVAVGLYSIGFDPAEGSSGSSGSFRHPVSTARFFVSELGNVLGSLDTAGGHDTIALVLGSLILVASTWAMVTACRWTLTDGSAIGAALILFGLLFAASAAWDRSALGLAAASRYSLFVLPLWVGTYLVACSAVVRLRHVPAPDGPTVRRSRVAAAVLVAVVALLAVPLVVGGRQGLADARGWRSQELTVADITANVDRAPDGVLSGLVSVYRPLGPTRELVRFARTDRLGLFATPLAAAEDRRGLDPGLVVTVLRPVEGQRLSGRVVLDAGTHVAGVTGVQFLLSGGGRDGVPVAAGAATAYGWIAGWDSHQVPDGSYTIRARAHVAGTASWTSAPVDVVVGNRP